MTVYTPSLGRSATGPRNPYIVSLSNKPPWPYRFQKCDSTTLLAGELATEDAFVTSVGLCGEVQLATTQSGEVVLLSDR